MKGGTRWHDRLGLAALVACAVAAAALGPAQPATARPVSARRLPSLQWSMSCRWLSALPDAAR